MHTDYLDCSNEVSNLHTSVPTKRAWLAADIQTSDWFLQLSTNTVEEIHRMAGFIRDNPLQNLQRKASDFRIEHCRETIAEMKTILDHGVGFCVLDRLPMEEYPIEILVEIFWVLGQLVGRPVAQKWDGQMIYDVTDTGQTYSYGVRGSHTNVELVFHTDNAFARMVPDYVGLFCRYPAVSGGVSRFCSLYSVHQRMLESYPEELKRLYQPMYFDRQKEHREGAPRVCLAPYFSWRGDRLYARANSSLVRKGYDVAGKSMDQELESALHAIDTVCASEDLWFEAPLERGQIQYLNNHEVGHYRSEFVDHEDPAKKRHLFRLWHREEGSVCYDGVVFS
ncbi:MAG: TauD/TfdA family dioxygenase [Arenicellales bacterium]|nr:TauD/TfdA family dioxygenase [Arenicellales bacterium]